MTPAARIATAAELTDLILAGEPAEKALTTWARRSRFAGSKDRAAIRDHVFDALRCRRSYAALGGSETGRGLMLGWCLANDVPPSEVFTGEGHGPASLSEAERSRVEKPIDLNDLPGPIAGDMPDWIWPQLEDALGDQVASVCAQLRHRAPVFLRVNLRKISRDDASALLAAQGIATRPHACVDTALEVTDGARQIARSDAYIDGLVELQDAASQAVTDALDLRDGMRVLDYCAGGGGKTLAMAGRAKATFVAHDANPARLRDLTDRAARAGVRVQLTSAPKGPFDLVLCDVPCSGSGSWRRAPEGKWILTPEALERLNTTQDDILDQTAPLVAEGGTLAYATCSLLRSENEDRAQSFIDRHPEWTLLDQRRWHPGPDGDGFFLARFAKK
ncbi:RsmB/NOP family class I SAM-dependent RNA methyltransferase [Pseudooceanicola onchidii]|uniref:RsmB/NOP family class I SAM-dependent RNA methyltransferase n=1 Tax=Pseudooceanicola onchidii TaxID=2562279 RepID=UPI0010A9EACB|nr:RsmB/NOP family class I SAM-dependent RNA methyltransferase [Pseudooceanicola onchidii]